MRRLFINFFRCFIIIVLLSPFCSTYAENNISQLRAEIPERFVYDTTTVYGDRISIDVPIVLPVVTEIPILRVHWNMTEKGKSQITTTWPEDDDIKTDNTHYAKSFPIAEDQAPESTICPDDAMQAAMDLFKEYCPNIDIEYYSQYARSGIYLIPESKNVYYDETEAFIASHNPISGYEKGSYCIRARQLLHKIPIFFQQFFCISNSNDPSDPCPQITASYMDQKHYSVDIETVLIDDTVIENVKLFSYKQIEEQIHKYIDLGLIQRMDKLELGYMLYYENSVVLEESKVENRMLAIPTWTVSGYFSMNAYEGLGPNTLPERSEWAKKAEQKVETYMGTDCLRIDALTGRCLFAYEDPAPRIYNLQEALTHE